MICAEWDAHELLRRTSPELRKVAPDAKVVQYFAVFSQKLGPPKNIGAPTGGAFFTFGTSGFAILASYDVPATFERGEGVVRLTLAKHDGRWCISSFFVNSDLLLQ